MKRTLFTLLTCMATVAGVAQTNIAAKHPSIATSGNAALGNDSNTGTRWESEHKDPQNWQVDLETAQDFNAIQIKWEGAYAKTFTIVAGNTVGADGYLTDGEVIATVEGQNLSGFPYTQIIDLGKVVNARYVEFKGTARGTVWGYSFYEFGIFNLDTPLKATSLTISSDITNNQMEIGATGKITATAKNQLDGAQKPLGEVSYKSSDENVGTIAPDGTFTAKSPGTTEITASVDGLTSNSITIKVVGGKKIDLFANNNIRVYAIGNTPTGSQIGAFDDKMESLWEMWKVTGADEASRTYNCGFIADLGGVYDLSSNSITFEGACSQEYTLEFAGEDGVFGHSIAGGTHAPGVNGHTETPDVSAIKGARYVKFLSTKAATQYSVKIYDFTLSGNGTPTVDTQAPTIADATAGTSTEKSITINVTGNDNSSKFLAYEIKADGVDMVYANSANKAGEASAITIPNLSSGKSYDFAITAIDAQGHRSEAKHLTVATSGDVFVLQPAPAPTVDATKVKSIFSDAYTPATAFTYGEWNQTTQHNTVKVEGKDVLHLTNFNHQGFEYAADLDLKDMNMVHIDIYPRQDMQMRITPIMRGGNPVEKSTSVGTLVANQWNSLDIPLAAIGLDYANFASFQLKLDGGSGTDEVYVDNIYFYNNGVGSFFVQTANSVATVAGDITADNVEQINSADAMLIDLTGVSSIAEGVQIKPAHKNALIKVKGSKQGDAYVADTKYAAIAGTPNMVIFDPYTHPVTQLQFVDEDGEAQWMGEGAANDGTRFLSTGSVGYKVTRSIPAHQFVTTYATAMVSQLPAGITAWEATGYDGTTVSFDKRTRVAPFMPYVLYNSNDEATDFVFEGTGDLNLREWATGNVAPHTVGTAAFQGNFAPLTTDGNQWILQNATGTGSPAESLVIKKGNGATIGAFRAYFTGLTASAGAKFAGFEQATAIHTIATEAVADGKVYNLSGVEMQGTNLPKGIYIKNGKKFVVK